MSETPDFEEMPEAFRPYVAEIMAKAIDLISDNPELKGIPADKLAMVYQAGVIAGFETAMKVNEDYIKG